MSPNRTASSFVIVVLVHVGILTAVAHSPTALQPPKIEQPTIQGVLIASKPVIKPPKPPLPPEQKPQVTPKDPLPKASTSERAVKQQVQPEIPPTAKPVEQTPAEPIATSVAPPQSDATQLNNRAPDYPTQSRRLHEEGVVILEVFVKADGSLGDMRLKASSGYSRLDEAAQRAVKNWRFIPAKRGGEPIDFWYELPIEFSLNH